MSEKLEEKHMKYHGDFTIPLAEIQTVESVAACGNSGERFFHDKPLGFRVTDIGRGVLCELAGQADVLLYPHMVKRAIPLTDIMLPGTKAPKPIRKSTR